MARNEFNLLEMAEGITLEVAERAREKQIAIVVFMEPELPTLFDDEGEVLSSILRSLCGTIIELCSDSVDMGISISAGDPLHDRSVSKTPLRIGLFYTDMQKPASLSNVEALVARLNSKLLFRQDIGRGSEFYFNVDLQVSERISCRPLYSFTAEDTVRTFVISNEPAPNRSIHLNMRFWGLRCDGAPTMQEGLLELTREAAVEEPYNLLIVAEPIDDGTPIQIAQAVRNSDLREMKLLHIDRFYNEVEKRKSLESGFDAYLPKPFTQKEFLRTVAELIGMKTEEQQFPVKPLMLVVEDNVVNQKLAVYQLRRLGLEAAVAQNGKVALEALSRTNFSLVLLDLDMPVMGGMETLRRIRNNDRFKKLPVIILTANGDEDVRAQCLSEGANEFVQKPMSVEQLEAIIDRWVNAYNAPQRH